MIEKLTILQVVVSELMHVLYFTMFQIGVSGLCYICLNSFISLLQLIPLATPTAVGWQPMPVPAMFHTSMTATLPSLTPAHLSSPIAVRHKTFKIM